MITYFPPLYPDEAVYSIGFRIARDCNLGYYGMIREVLGDGNARRINPLVGINLEYLFSQLPDSYTYTMKRMINEHTLLPLFKINTLKDDYLLMLKKMNTHIGDVIKSIGKSNSKNSTSHLKYCDLCKVEDKVQHGESYFHREHQLGGNLMCHKHAIPLKTIKLKAKGAELININEVKNGDNQESIPKMSNSELEEAYDIAIKIRFLLENHTFISGEHTKTLYMNTLIAHDYLDGGLFRKREIQERILERYNAEFLKKLGCEDFLPTNAAILGRLYHETKSVLDPIKNIVFIESILGKNFDLILNSNAHMFADRVIKGNAIKDEELHSYIHEVSLKEKIKSLYRYRVVKIKEDSERCGRKKVRDEMAREYVWLTNNDKGWLNEQLPKYIYDNKELTFNINREKYRKALIREVKKDSNISRSDLYKLLPWAYMWLRDNDREWVEEQLQIIEKRKEDKKVEYRIILLEFIKKNPEYSRSKISQMLLHEYNWLLNHDKEWLQDNLPDKKREVNLSIDERREKYRDGIRSLLARNKNIIRSQVRQQAGYAYTWLKKNDEEWLEAHLLGQEKEEELLFNEKKKRYRKIIGDILNENPSITIKELKEQSQYAYRWLFKNDQEWLDTYLLSEKRREELLFNQTREKYRQSIDSILGNNENISKMQLIEQSQYAYRWLSQNDKEWLELHLTDKEKRKNLSEKRKNIAKLLAIL